MWEHLSQALGFQPPTFQGRNRQIRHQNGGVSKASIQSCLPLQWHTFRISAANTTVVDYLPRMVFVDGFVGRRNPHGLFCWALLRPKVLNWQSLGMASSVTKNKDLKLRQLYRSRLTRLLLSNPCIYHPPNTKMEGKNWWLCCISGISRSFPGRGTKPSIPPVGLETNHHRGQTNGTHLDRLSG